MYEFEDQPPSYEDVELPTSPYAPNINWSEIAVPSNTSYGSPVDFFYAASPTGGDVSAPGLAGLLQSLTGGAGKIGELASSAIKALTQDSQGNLDMRKLATIGGGLAGLLGIGNRPPEKVGYQGQIPALTAVRERVPQTDEQRPGAAGRRYFSDVQYVAPEQAAAARQAAAQQAAGLAQLNARPAPGYAEGGIAGGYYLGGKTDGMADEIPANIDGKQPAKLSDGEFVVPADVVSHLGNGNSEAGAQRLYEMMDRIRKARTGTTKQGRQIKPEKLLPA